MPVYSGKLIEVKRLVITVFGIEIVVTASIEVFDIRKRVE
jgi:hypothetical protein